MGAPARRSRAVHPAGTVPPREAAVRPRAERAVLPARHRPSRSSRGRQAAVPPRGASRAVLSERSPRAAGAVPAAKRRSSREA
jgi:hypothetical protein